MEVLSHQNKCSPQAVGEHFTCTVWQWEWSDCIWARFIGLNWESSLWIFSQDAPNHTEQFAASSSVPCQICARSAPVLPNLLWQKPQILLPCGSSWCWCQRNCSKSYLSPSEDYQQYTHKSKTLSYCHYTVSVLWRSLSIKEINEKSTKSL